MGFTVHSPSGSIIQGFTESARGAEIVKNDFVREKISYSLSREEKGNDRERQEFERLIPRIPAEEGRSTYCKPPAYRISLQGPPSGTHGKLHIAARAAGTVLTLTVKYPVTTPSTIYIRLEYKAIRL